MYVVYLPVNLLKLHDMLNVLIIDSFTYLVFHFSYLHVYLEDPFVLHLLINVSGLPHSNTSSEL